MQIIQIIGIAIALFYFFVTLLRYHEGKITLRELLLWESIWAAIAFISILPITVNFFANLIGVGRGVDLVLYLSIIALFYLMFKIYMKIDKVEREITAIVRELAIRDKKKK